MSFFFQKPENALKRAKELMSIPNVDAGVLKRTKRSALEILHDALIAKKNRTWQPTHEELMILYLDICMELQLGRIAKDGLHQYRNLSIQHNPASLETVITHFVSQTEQKLAQAKRESNDLIILAAAKVDLEAAQTPEAVMLSTTTFEGSSDRTDREVVVPWLRFTWETYRTVLDILKNNTKLEGLYKSIALKAFDFCVEYTRKIEFRRLCEILRNHLGSLQKHSAAPTSQSSRLLRSWDGFTLEGVESLLEIRYRQLQVATDLELFSEAFRTIDDINTIMSLVEQVPRLELMVTYYEKLAQIFLVSKNHLFHAYALYKWYSLRVGGLEGINGGAALALLPSLVKAEEQEEIATRVVLAALSIPLLEFESASPVLDNDSTPSAVNSAESSLSSTAREKNARMAALLGFAATPTRANLLDEIDAAGIIKKAVPEVSSLYFHLERQEVDPLQIVKQVKPNLEKIRELSNSYKNQTQEVSYSSSVERLLVRRVLFQLTRVYSSVTIAHLRSLFMGLNVSYQEIEQLIVRSRSLSTVAHASAPSLSSMYLKNQSGNSSSNTVEASTSAATATAARTKIRIDHVQQIIRFSDAVELEANPAQLTLLGERLDRVLKKVQYSKNQEALEARRTKLFENARSKLDATRSVMLERREIIERKKEELERLQQEKVKTLEKKRQEYEQQRQQVERERLEQEAKRRELEKKQKIKDEIALKETKQMLDKLGHKDLDNIDLENFDREKVLNEAKEKAQKAKEDAQRKLRDSARRLDYIIRATREVEQPILQKQFAATKEDAKQQYEQEKQEKLKIAKEAYELGLKEKERLATAFTVFGEFVEAHHARRRELYTKAAEEHQKKALLERLEKRVAHAKERYDEEQERLREEEEERERIRREEEEARERARQLEIEEELRRQEEEEEENRRLAEEEKERELAAEKERERQERERESSINSRFGSAGSSYRPPMRAGRSDRDDGEWTQVSRSSSSRVAAPEGNWDRRGPAARDERGSSRFGDREDRGFSRFGDREPREGGLRRAFGGDRDDREPREGGLRRAFGGDRDDREPREGGMRRNFGGDREERPAREDGPSGGWRRGGDRDAAAEDRFFGGRREGGEGSYRAPRGDSDRRPPPRDSVRAPESGRWR
ncbi:hypothetical protein FI667_g17098, partial [Globisporangium splendens]